MGSLRVAAQTVNAFASFEPEPGLKFDADMMAVRIHAFDLIVADECHRRYTSAVLCLWRNILDNSGAIKVGLTATPAAHTKAYFTDVVDRYEYERAVREGYLADFDAWPSSPMCAWPGCSCTLEKSRVALGGCPPRAPTDPYMRN